MAGSHQSPLGLRICKGITFGFRPLLGLPVLLAMGLGTMPAQALPAASVQLFRVNGNGLKPMPGITDALDQIQAQRTALAPAPQPGQTKLMLVAQSDPGTVGALSGYSQSFVGPLPANLSGNLRLVYIDSNTGTIGQVLEVIDVNGPYVTISPDRLQITIQLPPGTTIQPGQTVGQTVMLQFPSTTPTGQPISYPNHLASTPCQFTVTAVSTAPAVVAPIGAAAAAPAGISPLLIVGAVVLVGVGVAAAAGAFSGGGGGGGGTNPSSR